MGWSGGQAWVCRPASLGLTSRVPTRLLQNYLQGLEKMEEEPEHMSREQGEGLGRGAGGWGA